MIYLPYQYCRYYWDENNRRKESDDYLHCEVNCEVDTMCPKSKRLEKK